MVLGIYAGYTRNVHTIRVGHFIQIMMTVVSMQRSREYGRTDAYKYNTIVIQYRKLDELCSTFRCRHRNFDYGTGDERYVVHVKTRTAKPRDVIVLIAEA